MEDEVKKRTLLGLTVLLLSLFLVSCADLNYEAYVTIVNIGNLPMNAWVDGDKAEIDAYDSVTWSIPLDHKNEFRTVLLEAEPLDGGDSDEITITLQGDRDVQTWLTGWDQLQGSQRSRKPSSLISGPAPK